MNLKPGWCLLNDAPPDDRPVCREEECDCVEAGSMPKSNPCASGAGCGGGGCGLKENENLGFGASGGSNLNPGPSTGTFSWRAEVCDWKNDDECEGNGFCLLGDFLNSKSKSDDMFVLKLSKNDFGSGADCWGSTDGFGKPAGAEVAEVKNGEAPGGGGGTACVVGGARMSSGPGIHGGFFCDEAKCRFDGVVEALGGGGGGVA